MAIRFLNSQSIDGSLTVSGLVYTGNKIDVRASSTESAGIQIGEGRTGNGFSYLDFVGNTAYPDFGLRLSYDGTTGNAYLNHRGSGGLILRTTEVAPVVFQMNAAEKMRVATNGNVGIGTTNPDKLLVVSGDGAEIVINDTDTTDTPRLRLRESGATSGSIYTDGKELIFDSGTTEKMRIDTDGNVGIGTTSPGLSYGGKGLQIQNTDTAGLRLTDTTGADFDISARSGDVLLYEGEGNPIRIGVGGNEKMRGSLLFLIFMQITNFVKKENVCKSMFLHT